MLTALLAAAASPPPRPACAEVVGVVVDRRDTIPFGYERLVGRMFFAFDPASPWNGAVVDLDRAPRNAGGRVEAWSDFVVLRPRDPRHASGVVLFDVPNRGVTYAIRHFNRAEAGFTAERLEDFGDGFLMRRGITVVWVAWQFDVPREPGRLRFHTPTATDGARPIHGLVRSDWWVWAATRALAIASRGHVAYRAVDTAGPEDVLTVRDAPLAPRRVVPRDQWRLGRDSITLRTGRRFTAGRIYELVYRARDPVVAGLGLAALRDAMAYARYDSASLFPARVAIAFGVSQSGRVLRQFLHDGFDIDERGRTVVDAVWAHVAGAGRASVNHRFAQPSRLGTPTEDFFFPIDLPPFTGRDLRARRRAAAPKAFFTNTGSEYWSRGAALIHSSPDGRADVPPPAQERVYHFAGGQHLVGAGNPLDFRFTLRALLVGMIDWVRGVREPPPSAIPRIADGTLVDAVALRFPALPGLSPPHRPYRAFRLDFGPRWARGIIDREPPLVGAPYPALVPQVDSLGNEIGGIRSVELTVPLATYTSWRLRGGAVAPDEIAGLEGASWPLPRTRAERRRRDDPRPAIASLYADQGAFLGAVSRAARALVDRRLLLPEDMLPVRQRAAATWDRIVGHR